MAIRSDNSQAARRETVRRRVFKSFQMPALIIRLLMRQMASQHSYLLRKIMTTQ